MKFLLDKARIKTGLLFFFLLAFVASTYAQFPPIPKEKVPVYDFAHVLSAQQVNKLNNELARFENETSTAIVLVTVDDLHDYDKAQYAVELAHKWGLGQKGKDNGILVLVKPKTTSSAGQAYIAVGYGLESVVPDAVGKKIVEYEMIPAFKKGDYYAGLASASKVLMELTRGSYSADDYVKQKGGGFAALIPLLIFVILFVIFTMGGRRNRSVAYGSGSSKSGLPWWAWMMLGSSMGNRSNSGWSNFNSGGGSFGGGSGFGGGGFGGFGGGGFGGGGAGGSW